MNVFRCAGAVFDVRVAPSVAFGIEFHAKLGLSVSAVQAAQGGGAEAAVREGGRGKQ